MAETIQKLTRASSNLSAIPSQSGRRMSNAGSVSASVNRRTTAAGGNLGAGNGGFAVPNAIVASCTAPHRAVAEEGILNALSRRLNADPNGMPTHAEEDSVHSAETLVDLHPFGATVPSSNKPSRWRSQNIDYHGNTSGATGTDQEYLNFHHMDSFDTFHNDQHLVTMKDLFRPLIVRQWLHKGKLYREADERVPSRFELFWDLVIVAIVHVLADKAAENVTGEAVLRFILVFYPVWQIWSNMKTFTNQSGTDDVVQRCYVLWTMLLLVGYTASAAVIITPNELLEHATSEEEGSENGHINNNVVNRLAFPYIRSAILFYVVARFTEIVYLCAYFYHLSAFRVSYFLQISLTFITTMFYSAIIFRDGSNFEKAALAITAIMCDLFLAFPLMLYARIYQRRLKAHEKKDKQKNGCPFSKAADARLAKLKKTESNKIDLEKQESDVIDPNYTENNETVQECFKFAKKDGLYFIAINIEHAVDRLSAFVIVVLGDIVLNVLFTATGSGPGLTHAYGRAALGLVTVFAFNWSYFDGQFSARFVHAFRRHIFAGWGFTHAHLPLVASLILASSGLKILVNEEHSVSGVRWYYGGGLSVALLSMTIIGALHRSLDAPRSAMMGREARIILRSVIVVAFALFPLLNIRNIAFIGIYSGISTFLVTVECYGRLRCELAAGPPVEQHEPPMLVDNVRDAPIPILNNT